MKDEILRDKRVVVQINVKRRASEHVMPNITSSKSSPDSRPPAFACHPTNKAISGNNFNNGSWSTAACTEIRRGLQVANHIKLPSYCNLLFDAVSLSSRSLGYRRSDYVLEVPPACFVIISLKVEEQITVCFYGTLCRET